MPTEVRFICRQIFSDRLARIVSSRRKTSRRHNECAAFDIRICRAQCRGAVGKIFRRKRCRSHHQNTKHPQRRRTMFRAVEFVAPKIFRDKSFVRLIGGQRVLNLVECRAHERAQIFGGRELSEVGKGVIALMAFVNYAKIFFHDVKKFLVGNFHRKNFVVKQLADFEGARIFFANAFGKDVCREIGGKFFIGQPIHEVENNFLALKAISRIGSSSADNRSSKISGLRRILLNVSGCSRSRRSSLKEFFSGTSLARNFSDHVSASTFFCRRSRSSRHCNKISSPRTRGLHLMHEHSADSKNNCADPF